MTEQPEAPEPPALRASNADRERVAQILHTAASEGRITFEELEVRLDQVYAAKTLAELAPVTVDLPVTPSDVARPQSQEIGTLDSRIGGTPGSAKSISILSDVNRKGMWVLPAQHSSFALLGEIDIDLSQARFAEHHSTITAVAILGEITIIVPDDVNVEITGVGMLGSFRSKTRGADSINLPAGAPTLKINGFSLLGEVTIVRTTRRRLES